MQQFDTIPRLMFESAGKTNIMTPEEEQDLSRKLREMKLGLWDALLSDPLTVKDALAFCSGAAERQTKQRRELDTSSFSGLVRASQIFHKRPIKANGSALVRIRGRVAQDLAAFDPCMKIALDLLREVKTWQSRIHPVRSTTYARYLQRIDSCWKRYVFYRNQFTERNIRLVISISKKFVPFEVSREDMIQEGVFGLQKAVGMFDPDRGFKFSTYASWWIRAFISRYCRDKGRTVRLPVNMQERLERYYAAVKKLEREGEDVDDEVLSEMMNVHPDSVRRLRKFTLEKCYSTEYKTSSGIKFGDLLEDPRDHIGQAELEFDIGLIDEVMESMPARERQIIRARFGLDDGDGKTLQEIADIWEISRERVRQIQNRALRDLKKRLERRRDRIAMQLPARPDENLDSQKQRVNDV